MLPSPPPPPEESLPPERQPQNQGQQNTPPPPPPPPPPSPAQLNAGMVQGQQVASSSAPSPPPPAVQSSFWSNPLGGIWSALQTAGRGIQSGASQAANFVSNAAQGWQDISNSLWGTAQGLESSQSPLAKAGGVVVSAGAEAAEIPAGMIGAVQSIWNPRTPDFLSMGVNYATSAAGLGGGQVAAQQRQFLLNPRNIGYDIGDIGGQVAVAVVTGEAFSAAGRGLESVAEGESRFAPVAERVLGVGRAANRVVTAPFRLLGSAGEAIGEKLGFSPSEFVRSHIFPDETYGLRITSVTRTEVEEGGRSAYRDLFTIERAGKISPEIRDLLSLGKPVGVSGTVTEEATSLARLSEHAPSFEEGAARGEEVLTRINVETEVEGGSGVNLWREGESAARQISSSLKEIAGSKLVEPVGPTTPYEAMLEQRNLSFSRTGVSFFADIETAEQGILEVGKNSIMEFRSTGMGTPSELARISQTAMEVKGVQMEFDEKALEEAGYSAEDLEKLLPKEVAEQRAIKPAAIKPPKIPHTNPGWGRPVTEPGEVEFAGDWRNFTGEQGTGKIVENPVTKGGRGGGEVAEGWVRTVSGAEEEAELEIVRYPEGKAPPALSQFAGFETVRSRGLESLASGLGFGFVLRLGLSERNLRTVVPGLTTTTTNITKPTVRSVPLTRNPTKTDSRLIPRFHVNEIPTGTPVTVPTLVPVQSESWPPREVPSPKWPGVAPFPLGTLLPMGPEGGGLAGGGHFYREIEHGINTNPFEPLGAKKKR